MKEPGTQCAESHSKAPLPQGLGPGEGGLRVRQGGTAAKGPRPCSPHLSTEPDPPEGGYRASSLLPPLKVVSLEKSERERGAWSPARGSG